MWEVYSDEKDWNSVPVAKMIPDWSGSNPLLIATTTTWNWKNRHDFVSFFFLRVQNIFGHLLAAMCLLMVLSVGGGNGRFVYNVLDGICLDLFGLPGSAGVLA